MAKKRNKPGRKSPAFAELVHHMVQLATLTPTELIQLQKEQDPDAVPKVDEQGRIVLRATDLPDGALSIETPLGHWVFDEETLEAGKPTLVKMMQEFHSHFWNEEGQSILKLRRDRKNRVWAHDETIMFFAYLLIGSGLARWTHPRSKWKDLEQGLPYITFTGPKRGEELTEGEQDEHTTEPETAESESDVQGTDSGNGSDRGGKDTGITDVSSSSFITDKAAGFGSNSTDPDSLGR